MYVETRSSAITDSSPCDAPSVTVIAMISAATQLYELKSHLKRLAIAE